MSRTRTDLALKGTDLAGVVKCVGESARGTCADTLLSLQIENVLGGKGARVALQTLAGGHPIPTQADLARRFAVSDGSVVVFDEVGVAGDQVAAVIDRDSEEA